MKWRQEYPSWRLDAGLILIETGSGPKKRESSGSSMVRGLHIAGRRSGQGHGIHPMPTPGVTPAQTPEREPAAPCHTMQLQSLDGVFRTAGPVATAGRKDAAESALVALHHGCECPHERTLSHGGLIIGIAGFRGTHRAMSDESAGRAMSAASIRVLRPDSRRFRRPAASASNRSSSARNCRLMTAKPGDAETPDPAATGCRRA